MDEVIAKMLDHVYTVLHTDATGRVLEQKGLTEAEADGLVDAYRAKGFTPLHAIIPEYRDWTSTHMYWVKVGTFRGSPGTL